MITLTKLLGATDGCSYCHVWPLRIEATSSEVGLSSKIFLYARNSRDGICDIFLDIADTVEMKEVAEDKPRAGSILFRKNTVEFSCRSKEVRTGICNDFDELIKKFNADWAASKLANSETYVATGD